jgi:integrase
MGKLNISLDKNSLEKLEKNVSSQRDRILLKILIETSCKTNELIEIKIKDLAKYSIKIKERRVTISKDLFIICKKFAKQNKKNPNDFLFSSRQSDKLTTKRIRQIIQKDSSAILKNRINPEDIRKISIKEKLKKKDVNEIKKEIGLKRFDKRKYLDQQDILKIKKSGDKRTRLLFDLLLSGLKSKSIINLKVKDIKELKIKENIKDRLIDYSFEKGLSNNHFIFLTREKTHLTKERIYQVIKQNYSSSTITINPRILNNSAIYIAASSKDYKKNLLNLGIKTHQFYLFGGMVKND